MKRWAVPAILAFCLTLQPVWAVRGRVLGTDGNPLTDATVSILGHPGSVRTDGQGYFNWQPDPTPPFEIVVVLSNGRYTAPVLFNEIPGEGILEVRVTPMAQDSITVTSGVTPNIEAPPASAMTVVGRRDLETRQPSQLAEALENIPGVSRISEGTAAVPAIRGLAKGRTLLLIDGGRVTSERRAGPSATYLDPFFLEGVEIARGPGSVAYGSDAFGGVIHARTRRPEPKSPLGFRFQAMGGLGTPAGGGSFEATQGFDKGGILFRSSFRQFGDYSSPLGEVDNSGSRNRSLLGRFDHEVGSGQLSIGFQSDRGMDIGRPRTDSDSNRFFYPREDSDRFTASYDLDPRGGFSRIQTSFFVGRYRLLTRRDRLPEPGEPRTISDSDVKAGDYGARLLLVRPLRRARLEVGMDFNGRFGLEAISREVGFDNRDEVVSFFEEQSITNARRLDNAGYATLEWMLADWLSWSGGLRFSHLSSRSEGGFFGSRSRSDSALSGFTSLGVTPLPGLTFTGQFSRGFREPTLSDRYFRGVSGRGFITGNPDLEPETSRQFDFSGQLREGPLRFGVYLYHYRFFNLIERFEAGDDLFFFRNRGSARLRGVELEAEWQIRPSLSFTLGAQRARGRTPEDNQPLDDVPSNSLTLVFRKTIHKRGHLQLRSVLFGRDQQPGPTEIVTPGYGQIDLAGGWTWPSGIGLQVQLRNLLDKDFPASPDRRATAAPGRSATVLLSFGF